MVNFGHLVKVDFLIVPMFLCNTATDAIFFCAIFLIHRYGIHAVLVNLFLKSARDDFAVVNDLVVHILDFARADVYFRFVDLAHFDIDRGLLGDNFSPLVLYRASDDNICHSALSYLCSIHL